MSIKQKKSIFIVSMWTTIIIFLLLGLLSHGQTIISILHNFPDDTFMDFFNSIQYETMPYEKEVIYPPLANLIYYILHAFIPQNVFEQGPLVYRTSQMGMLVLAMYIVITTLFLIYTIQMTYKGNINEKFLLCLTILLSGPFIYQLERANIILVCLCFIMIYVCGYDSDNRIVRHIAFISLAIAASLKIYPAIFGLLLVKERRWKDVFICCLYGLIIFISPIVFFGGLKNFPLFINNLFSTSDYMSSNGYGWKVNITNTFGWLGILLGHSLVLIRLQSLLA